MLPCSAPSSLTATPSGNACSLNVPSFWFDVEEVRRRVVRHVEIRPAVVVVVEPGDAEAEVAARIRDAGLFGYVGEAPVAVVVEEQVPLARQAARAALHGDAAVLAGLVLAELGQMREIDLHVAADEQIEPPVAIVVGEAAARRPSSDRDAGLLGDVGERAVAIVAIQMVAAERGHVEILPAVAVHVRRADAHAPARVADAGLVGDVLESSVAEIAIERAARRVRIVGGVHRQRVHEVDVRQPVVVVVEERHAAAHRLDDESLFRRGVMLERNAGFARDVAKEQLGAAGGCNPIAPTNRPTSTRRAFMA